VVEPSPLAREKAEAEAFNLWSDAPGWRALTVAATLFTVAAASLYLPTLTSAPSPGAPTAPPRLADHGANLTPVSPPPPSNLANLPQQPVSAAPTMGQGTASGAAQTQAVAPAPALETADAPAHAPRLARAASPADPTATHDQAVVAAEPQAAPLPQQTVCLLVAPPAPTRFSRGTVMAFEDRATSLARTKRNEAELGGKIDPDFIDNQRVNVRLSSGSYHIFIVPRTMAVRLGDAVAVQSLYKNVNRACEYIPPLVTSDLGPAPDKDSPTTASADH